MILQRQAERGTQLVEVDLAGFDTAMNRQRLQARAAGKFKMAEGLTYSGLQTVFQGYESEQAEGVVVALYVEGSHVDRITAGQDAIVVLDTTPFYAESGGQVGDTGQIGKGADFFHVYDTISPYPGVIAHLGKMTGKLRKTVHASAP